MLSKSPFHIVRASQIELRLIGNILENIHKDHTSHFTGEKFRLSLFLIKKLSGQALTACKHMVSDLFHSPSWGIFHLSLAELVHYRSQNVFSFARWSWQFPAGFHVTRGTQVTNGDRAPFAYAAITRCGGPFQNTSARNTMYLLSNQ